MKATELLDTLRAAGETFTFRTYQDSHDQFVMLIDASEDKLDSIADQITRWGLTADIVNCRPFANRRRIVVMDFEGR